MLKYCNILLLLLFVINVQGQDNKYLKAYALFQSDQYQGTLEMINSLNAKERNNAEILILKGKTLNKLNFTNEAINTFLEAEKQKLGLASFELSKAFALMGNAEESIKYLEKHLSSQYKLSRDEIILENAFKNIENTETWKNFWKGSHFSKREKLLDEIEYLIETGDYIEALDIIDENLKNSKKNHQLYYYRGVAFGKLENPKPAIKNYNKAIGINKRQEMYYLARSEAHQKNEKYKNALHDIEKYIQLNPTNFKAYQQKAQLLVNLERYDETIEFSKFFLELFPNNLDMSMKYAYANEKTGNYKEAVATYTQLMKEYKPSSNVYFARGNAHLSFEKLQDAMDDYSMALDLDPTNPEIYLNRGLARFRKGDSKGACIDWEKAAKQGQEQANKNLYYYCR